MIDGEFELDGVRWGGRRSAALLVEDFTPEGAEIENQDAQRPGGHGLLAGRDMLGGASWSWDVSTNHRDGQAALAEARALAAVWRSYVNDPHRLAVLRHKAGGEVRRVYGRPRRFAPPRWDILTVQGRGRIVMDFQLTDPLIYDDTPSVLELALTGTSGEGVRWPVTFPFVWGSAPGRRDGEVIVGGRADVPFTLTFHGPSSGTASAFWAQGPGWRVDLSTTLAWDQSATVDTRTSTVTRSDGRSLAGDARGRFLTARLQPGAQEIAWGATDPTNTASMTLTHHAGYHSL